ncbi:hypothetical protein KY348_05080 [Candidatus Woesearchaeota archaeon]|nr:hypothetical protein [Candidatus Woesearchaeota archaeon]
MKTKDKKAVTSLLGAIGLIILLVGIFTTMDFILALLIAIIIWILTGVLAKYWGVKKK